MQTTASMLQTFDRRVTRFADRLGPAPASEMRARRAYRSPSLELLADYGEGGTEPIRLQD